MAHTKRYHMILLVAGDGRLGQPALPNPRRRSRLRACQQRRDGRPVLVLVLTLTGIGVVAVVRPAAAAQAARRPNILFLFADDMRADTIAAHGNPHIRTPHLDDLARRGFSFRNAYVFGGDSGAVCVASRAMLMSGRTWFHVETPTLANAPLLPEVLGRAGYVTFATGKWHNGEASWLRAFQRGRTIMFGGMSDHTQVPVKDLGADGAADAAPHRDDVLERAVRGLRHRLPRVAHGAGAVLRVRRVHGPARSATAARAVSAGVLRAAAAAAAELPAAVPVRQRRDEGRARREPRRLAAHRAHGARSARRVLRHGHAPGRADRAHPRRARDDRSCQEHHRRVRRRQRAGPRQPRSARQAERVRAQHAGADDDRRPGRPGRTEQPGLHVHPRPLPDAHGAGGRGGAGWGRGHVAAAGLAGAGRSARATRCSPRT